MGAREYYVYDPQGEMIPLVQGFERRGDGLEMLPLTADGGVYSPLLRAELRPMAMGALGNRPAGVWLRVIDPATGQPVPLAEEERNSLQEERLARAAVEQQLLATDHRANAAERRATEEERARLAVEAELRALRAALAQHETTDPDTAAHAEGQGE